jgi:hypothetical protein
MKNKAAALAGEFILLVALVGGFWYLIAKALGVVG